MDHQEVTERRLAILEGALDIDPGSHQRCKGTPLDCDDCTSTSCPLHNNRVHELGSLVLTLIEEFRWHRAFAAELEHVGAIPKGTQARVALRVRKSQLEEALQATEATLQEVGTVQKLREEVERRIQEIQAEIKATNDRLEETP